MGHRDIIVIGASAGGVEVLLQLVASLPADLAATVFITLHVSPQSNSVLPQLLARAGKLPVAHAIDGAALQRGHVYVAPPDHHLLVRRGVMHLGRGPAENLHRPAIDPMFRSAAAAYEGRCIGVVLSGSLDDGTAGLAAVKQMGGYALVQDPAEAPYPSMPQSALDHVAVDQVVQVARLGDLLVQLTRAAVGEAGAGAGPGAAQVERYVREADMAQRGPVGQGEQAPVGVPSAFACPDCHGVLWELHEGKLVRYRCRVGHAYLPQSLAAAQSEQLEAALWTALRALKESEALATRLATRATKNRLTHVARTYEQRAEDAHERATLIERVLARGQFNTAVERDLQEDIPNSGAKSAT